MLHDIWMAEDAEVGRAGIRPLRDDVYCEVPGRDHLSRQGPRRLLTFYTFPAEHWMHIRTTNPIESTFATVRLRTKKTKGAGSRLACLTMVFKLALAAQKQWRTLNGAQLIVEVINGVPFVDGIRKEAA